MPTKSLKSRSIASGNSDILRTMRSSILIVSNVDRGRINSFMVCSRIGGTGIENDRNMF